MTTVNNLADAARNLSQLFQTANKSSSVLGNELVIISKKSLYRLANPILERVGLTKDTDEPVVVLDNCCGTGVVRQEIQKTLRKDILERSKFVCADNSAALVDIVKQRIVAEEWVNTDAQVLDATNTGLPENTFSHVIVALGLHIIPDPTAVINDAKRVLKPGGFFSSTTFHPDTAQTWWQSVVRDAFASFPFEAPFPAKFPMQMHTVGDWGDPSWIEGHFREQGLKDVDVSLVTGTTPVESAEDFTKTYMLMLPWIIKTYWSEETQKAHPVEEVKGLVGKFVEEKYGGKPFDIQFKVIVATGRV
ncbi:Methyltransferase tpcH [Paramyrothecium foliicola]|nr:Methyltransferase tpcH [Paramyrothecium foliicola]